MNKSNCGMAQLPLVIMFVFIAVHVMPTNISVCGVMSNGPQIWDDALKSRLDTGLLPATAYPGRSQ